MVCLWTKRWRPRRLGMNRSALQFRMKKLGIVGQGCVKPSRRNLRLSIWDSSSLSVLWFDRSI